MPTDPIKRGRKKHLRNLKRNKSGRNATVKMEFFPNEPKVVDNGRDKKKVRHYAAPSITFKGDEKARPQSFKEALKAGEVYEFKSKKRAERFAAGSWKKGAAKRQAMKAYRAKKKAERKAKKNK